MMIAYSSFSAPINSDVPYVREGTCVICVDRSKPSDIQQRPGMIAAELIVPEKTSHIEFLLIYLLIK